MPTLGWNKSQKQNIETRLQSNVSYQRVERYTVNSAFYNPQRVSQVKKKTSPFRTLVNSVTQVWGKFPKLILEKDLPSYLDFPSSKLEKVSLVSHGLTTLTITPY